MNRDAMALAVIFTGSGVIHFVKPELFEPIVPKPLPNKRGLVYVSGAIELACAAMLLNQRTRRFGGLVSVGLLAAVFPANVQMTLSAFGSTRASAPYKAATVARLPLQIPPLRAALRVARS